MRDRLFLKELQQYRENKRYLPGIPFGENLHPVAELEEALADKDSIWYFYQAINKFRLGNEVIQKGEYKCFQPKDKRTWCYLREYEGKQYVVVANYWDKPAKFKVPAEIAGKESKVLFHNYAEDIALADCTLKPYEGVAFEIV